MRVLRKMSRLEHAAHVALADRLRASSCAADRRQLFDRADGDELGNFSPRRMTGRGALLSKSLLASRVSTKIVRRSPLDLLGSCAICCTRFVPSGGGMTCALPMIGGSGLRGGKFGMRRTIAPCAGHEAAQVNSELNQISVAAAAVLRFTRSSGDSVVAFTSGKLIVVEIDDRRLVQQRRDEAIQIREVHRLAGEQHIRPPHPVTRELFRKPMRRRRSGAARCVEAEFQQVQRWRLQWMTASSMTRRMPP